MRAIVQDRYGAADVLELREIDRPVPGDDELLVRVHAAGVDRGVWHLMTGQPYLIRLMGYGLRRPKGAVPGMDVAGCVEAVGAQMKEFKPGDEVFGVCEGSYAEYRCTRGDRLALKPTELDFEQAAAVPVSAFTALQAVRDEGRVQPGQNVLVIGASGGVGTFAVQIAKAFGAEVTGVCSTSKIDLVRSIGADHVIDYTREQIGDGQRRFDVILDVAGNRRLSELRRALTPRGTLVIIGGEGGGRWLGGVGRQLRAALWSPFVSQQLRAQFPTERKEALQFIRQLIVDGRLKPVIDRTYPLHQAPEAIRRLEQGQARGKIVVTVREQNPGSETIRGAP